MEILFLLMAAMTLPLFEGDDEASEGGGSGGGNGGGNGGGSGGTDTATALGEDPTAPALNAATDANGNAVVQANGADNSFTGTSILDFITADPTLSALPIGSLELNGGDGDDTIDVADLDIRAISGGSGDDDISSFTFQGFGPDVVNGNGGADTIDAVGADIFGGVGDDSIDGGGNPEAGVRNEIDGGPGDDTIRSGELADIRGGAGDDVIFGAANDNVQGNAGDDTITLAGIQSTADGGAGDDEISFTYDAMSNSLIAGGAPADIATGVALTGGAGADDFIITGEFEEVPLSASGNSLFATVTDFDFAEDTLVIELDTAADPTVSGGGFEFNKNVTLINTVSQPGLGNFDISFSLTGENAAGTVEARTLTIRLQEVGTDLEFDFLDIVETDSGVAISLVPAAAPSAA